MSKILVIISMLHGRQKCVYSILFPFSSDAPIHFEFHTQGKTNNLHNSFPFQFSNSTFFNYLVEPGNMVSKSLLKNEWVPLQFPNSESIWFKKLFKILSLSHHRFKKHFFRFSGSSILCSFSVCVLMHASTLENLTLMLKEN